MLPGVAILVLRRSIVLKQGLHYGACRALAPMCLSSWESSLANDRTGTALLVLLSSDLDVGCRRTGSAVFGTGGGWAPTPPFLMRSYAQCALEQLGADCRCRMWLRKGHIFCSRRSRLSSPFQDGVKKTRLVSPLGGLSTVADLN